MTGLHILITILLGLAAIEARQVRFKNSCQFVIDVEATPGGILCRDLKPGGSCAWTIPAGGWNGNIHRRNREGNHLGYPSGTLAEFAFANSRTAGQWNWDWFDISIIPPGCPGTITSYESCWCNGGSDGYDVGMRITPVKCRNKQRTCLNRKCPDAYGFPKDDTKTTVCQDITGEFEVEFCPAGSHIDLGNTQLSQTPPCRGGPSTIVPPKNGNPPPPRPAAPTPRPPAPRPPSSASCTMDQNIDYFGNDLSNRPAGSKEECCNICATLSGCGAWTFAKGVCYFKRAAGSDRRSAPGLWSGTVRSRAVAADSQTFTANESQSGSASSTAIIAVLIVVAVIFVLFFIVGLVINIKLLSSPKISERA